MKIEIDDKMAAKLVKLAKDTGGDKLFVALSNAVKTARKDRREQNSAKCEAYRQAATMKHGSEGSCEIDPGAVVSMGDDPGAYVQAWVWVYDTDT